METESPVIIIGAGISGLSAAITVKESGRKVLLLESESEPGGRVRTDFSQGFRLDRGFQVLLKSYPEAQRFLDYKSLNLKPFLPGARILWKERNCLVMDPSRSPQFLFETLFSPIGTMRDKLKMLFLRLSLIQRDPEFLFQKKEISTLEYLRNYGFSENIIQNFFLPFLGGIFLENRLITSSRMFEFVFRLFGMGDTVVPELGMQEIPNQMARRLGYENIHFNEKVIEIKDGEVITDKNQYKAEAIFFAGGNLENYPGYLPETVKEEFIQNHPRSALTLYFSSESPPIKENIIVLNANESQIVNTLAVMDLVSESYSPKGIHLISITLKYPYPVQDALLPEKVKQEMSAWFPDSLKWNYLRSYFIPFALPDQDQVRNELSSYSISEPHQVYLCGDFLLNGSINAAMKSGRMAAEEFLRQLG